MSEYTKSEFMVTTVIQGSHETARLYIDFYQPWDPEAIKPTYTLASISIITMGSSYGFHLLRSDIAQQLTWNLGLYNRIKSLFGQKSANLILEFDPHSRTVSVSTENQLKAIRFLIFEKHSVDLLDSRPMFRLMRLLADFEQQKNQLLRQLARKEEQQWHKISQVESLNRQIRDSANDDTHHIKNKFIPLINSFKDQIRKRRAGNYEGVDQHNDEADERADERVDERVDERADERAEQGDSEKESRKIMKIFGGKREKKKEEKKKEEWKKEEWEKEEWEKEEGYRKDQGDNDKCIQDEFLSMLQ